MITHEPLFPVDLFVTDLNDAAWRDALREDILQWRCEEPDSIDRSNRLGWHSPNTAMNRAAFAPLNREILDAATDIFRRKLYAGNSRARLETMWANVNPTGAYHVPHSHGEALWSGVYWLETPPGSPGITFMDPRAAIGQNRPRLRFGPEGDRSTRMATAGRMIVFPGWLSHYVEPHTGVHPRISVSFNIRQIVREPLELKPPRTAKTPHYVRVPGVLSAKDCGYIVDEMKQIHDWQTAKTGRGVDPKVRDSDTSFIPVRHPEDRLYWVYDRIMTAARVVAANDFPGLDISRGADSLQMTRYRKGQFYRPHRDFGDQWPDRTLSCAITLQEADAGGGIEFPDAPEQPKTDIGDALFFRADELHGASAVTAGERISLVAWLRGKP